MQIYTKKTYLNDSAQSHALALWEPSLLVGFKLLQDIAEALIALNYWAVTGNAPLDDPFPARSVS